MRSLRFFRNAILIFTLIVYFCSAVADGSENVDNMIGSLPTGLNDTIILHAQTDSITQGQNFGVTLSGAPDSSYYLWLEGTGTMTGYYGDQPPVVFQLQDRVMQDPDNGPFVTGLHQILNGKAGTILDDVPKSTGKISSNRYYARILTDSYGAGSVLFETSTETKQGSYTIRAENNSAYDEVQIYVQQAEDILPVSTTIWPGFTSTSGDNLNTRAPSNQNDTLSRIAEFFRGLFHI